MGSGWIIKTFDRAKWDAIFGGVVPRIEQKIVDGMLWENDGYFDDESEEERPGPNRERILASKDGRHAQFLARHVVRNGLTYDGLDAAQALELDEFVARMAAAEMIGDDLGVTWHSPEHFSMTLVSELLDRTGNSRSWMSRITLFGRMGRSPLRVPVRCLPLLLTGRRFGTEAQPTRSAVSYYVVFSPAEVVALRQEVAAAANAQVPWRTDWSQSVTEDYLLAPLADVIRGKRWVLMTLNY